MTNASPATPATSAVDAALRQLWDRLRGEQPRLRIRDAAAQLGVSELQLLLTEPADELLRLEPRAGDIIKALEGLGRVMTLSRNQAVVHETKGVIRNVDIAASGQMGLCLGEIDLRLFLSKWKHAYAVRQAAQGGRDSLQFFDAAGGAVHKIYYFGEDGDATYKAAWDALIQRFTAPEQRPPIAFAAPEPKPPRSAPKDAQALLADWAAMTDTHQFHGLLKRHGADRLSALEAATPTWATPLAADTYERALTLAAERGQSIMAFVGNPGIVQIYSGTVHKLMRAGPWFNVMDDNFNLHANSSAIVACWRVRKPSEDGDIHSIECFDADDELVLTLFGERKPGIPEQAGWRQLLEALRV